MSGARQAGSGRMVLRGLEFHGHHGVHPEEGRLGARFVVDVELRLPLPRVDALAQTVDYGRVYQVVAAAVTGTRYKLIEALAHEIAARIVAAESLVEEVTVRVHKPHAPLPGVFEDVFVEVHARR